MVLIVCRIWSICVECRGLEQKSAFTLQSRHSFLQSGNRIFTLSFVYAPFEIVQMLSNLCAKGRKLTACFVFSAIAIYAPWVRVRRRNSPTPCAGASRSAGKAALYRSVPVIAMSAFFSQTDRTRTHHADFRACLAKPFTPDKLVDTILSGL
jgi:hypothetical protein